MTFSRITRFMAQQPTHMTSNAPLVVRRAVLGHRWLPDTRHLNWDQILGVQFVSLATGQVCVATNRVMELSPHSGKSRECLGLSVRPISLSPGQWLEMSMIWKSLSIFWRVLIVGINSHTPLHCPQLDTKTSRIFVSLCGLTRKLHLSATRTEICY